MLFLGPPPPPSIPQGDCETAVAEVLGRATPGARGVPQLELLGAPVTGLPLAFEITNARAGSTGFLILGDGVLPRALVPYGAVQFPAGGLWNAPLSIGDDGRSEPIGLVGPVPPELCGRELVAQAFIADPEAQGGLAFTRAARVRFGAAARRPLFPRTSYSLGEGRPAALDAGDLDADGHLDLVAVSSEAAWALFGESGGTFGQPIEIAALEASSVAVTDLDADGSADVVVGSEPGGKVTAFLSRAGDVFEEAGTSALGFSLSLLLGGDLDGDGDGDVLAQGPQRALLLGLGDGTFTPAATPPGSFLPVALRDMDHDGLLDIVGRSGGNATVSRGRGDATFEPPLASPAGGSVRALDCGDFDSDGTPDIGAGLNGGRVSVLLGAGDGTFSAPIVRQGTTSSLVTAGDVDGDGFADLVTLGDETLHVFHGHGDGSLSAERVMRGRPLPVDVLSERFDGDGEDVAFVSEIDTAVIGLYYPELLVVHGIGDGALSSPRVHAMFPPPSTNSSPTFTVADFDGDQVLDLVGSGNDFPAPLIRLSRGLGDGRFEPARTVSNAPGGSLAAADLDGDGDMDLACGDWVHDAVVVLPGDGKGGFGMALSFPATEQVALPLVADLDLDGSLDIAVRGELGSDDAFALLYARGDGSFEPARIFSPVGGPTALAIEDLTADGIPDLALAGLTPLLAPQRVQIWRGALDRIYSIAGSVGLSKSTHFLAAKDLDLDGIVDLVAAQSATGFLPTRTLEVLRGLGDGAFVQVTSLPTGSNEDGTSPRGEGQVLLTDLDRNGLPDIVANSWRGIEVLLGRGALAFDLPRLHSLELSGRRSSVKCLDAADVDGDWMPDLITMDTDSIDGSSILILPNQLLADAPPTLPSDPSAVSPARAR